MRMFPAALAVILGVALLAACGGGDKEEGGAAAPAAADVGATGTPQEGTPSASPTGGAQEVGCEFPSDIKSFRFEITMKSNLPTTPEAETPESEEPLGDPLGAPSGLKGDMKMEGALIAPDRSSVVMTAGGHEFGSFVQIGSQSWTRSGLAAWEEVPSEQESPGFSPTDFCLCAEADSVLSRLQGNDETVNGIKSVHYHLDKADLTALAEVGCLAVEDVRDIPGQVDMDVWLAENGDWPVRLGYKASGEDEQGQPVEFDVLIELKDFNDSSIKIEPPT